MYVLKLLLTFVIISITLIRAYEYSVNVGTVLFSPSDFHKSHWSKTELGLLKARRYFQEVLPPPTFIDTTNEEYIHTLLKYFKDTYSTIKREAESPVSDSLMTTAFSDALGGYLKLWVLPISKLSFYGGTVSQDNILKLYKFHNEIKRYLGTDGNGWHSPDRILLRSITISMASPRHVTRSMTDPCQHLAYYEKTENGLSIPTPRIDWESQTHTMFIPLRNQSLIPLESPNHPYALFKYYDAAKNCIDSSNNADRSEFDDRFQSWLYNDVVPHLSDEKIYLPLGSVLSLVNKSQSIFENVLDLHTTRLKQLKHIYVVCGIPIDFTSKKTWIIVLLLFLEVAWCIPSLIYLACIRRRKSKSTNDSKEGHNRSSNDTGVSHSKSSSEKLKTAAKSPIQGLKLNNRPVSKNIELKSHFCRSYSRSLLATDSRSYIGSDTCSVSVIHETMPPPLKSSMKKVKSLHSDPIQQHVSIDQSNSTRSTNKNLPQPNTTTINYSTLPNNIPKTNLPLKEMNELTDKTMVKISNNSYAKSASDHKRKNIPSIHRANTCICVSSLEPGEQANNCNCIVGLESGEQANICSCCTCVPNVESGEQANICSRVPTVESEEKNNISFCVASLKPEKQANICCCEARLESGEKTNICSFGTSHEPGKQADICPCLPCLGDQTIICPCVLNNESGKQTNHSNNVASHESPEQGNTIPYLKCLEAEGGSDITIVNQGHRAPEVCFDDKTVEIEDVRKKSANKPDKKSKNIGFTLESGRPYFEITIEKPQTEISVGFGFNPSKTVKRSKIPKRLPSTNKEMQTTVAITTTKQSPRTSSSKKAKSLIPQPKRRPVDDMDVKPVKPESKRKDNKLNVTL